MAVGDAPAGIEVVTWRDSRSFAPSFVALQEAPGDNIGFTETGRYFFRKPAKELKTHDLVGLARAAGIMLTPADVTLLERLTDFVEWAGRYPVGVAADQTASDAGAYYASDRDTVFAFVARLRDVCSQLDPNRELYKRMEREIYGDESPA